MPTAGMTLRWDIPKTLAAKALFSSHLSSLVCRPTKPVVGPRMKGGWRLQVGEGTRGPGYNRMRLRHSSDVIS